MDAPSSRRGGRRAALVVELFALSLVAVACGEPTVPLREEGTAAEAVNAVLAPLPAGGPYALDVLDGALLQRTADRLEQPGVQLTGGFELRNPQTCEPSGPSGCATLGSRQHLALQGIGEVRFESPRRVLGVHLGLGAEQVTALQALKPGQGSNNLFRLPQLRVLVTGLDASGQPTATVRAIPASATFAGTRVDADWAWLDLSLLGEVHGLRFAVESPLPAVASVLLDNLATSPDYRPSDAYFTIALIPDSQKYVETVSLLPLFEAQTRYLASVVSSERLVFVSHLGDIVEHGEREEEWVRAAAILGVLGGVVPHGLVVGNHDYEDEWNSPEWGSPRFLRFFPFTRFEREAWWAGSAPNGLSSAQLFPTPLGPFLYLHLSVDSPPPTVAWAQSIIDAHPKVPTFLTTHAYLRESGRIPVPYLSGTRGTWTGISADEVFSSLAAPNDQVVMVTCGHISAEHHQVSTNRAGHPVHELLTDYQNRENGGEGFLRLMRFYPARKEVRLVTYSPGLKTYEVDADSHFVLPLDLPTRVR